MLVGSTTNVTALSPGRSVKVPGFTYLCDGEVVTQLVEPTCIPTRRPRPSLSFHRPAPLAYRVRLRFCTNAKFSGWALKWARTGSSSAYNASTTPFLRSMGCKAPDLYSATSAS